MAETVASSPTNTHLLALEEDVRLNDHRLTKVEAVFVFDALASVARERDEARAQLAEEIADFLEAANKVPHLKRFSGGTKGGITTEYSGIFHDPVECEALGGQCAFEPAASRSSGGGKS